MTIITTGIPGASFVICRSATGKIEPGFGAGGLMASGPFRLPTDPLFYADLVLHDIVVGSRYRVTRVATGEELATGVAASDVVTLTGLPVFANPMRVAIAVRRGTDAPKYLPFDTVAYMEAGSSAAYISQIPDTIA